VVAVAVGVIILVFVAAVVVGVIMWCLFLFLADIIWRLRLLLLLA
jgi:hypothetical protein